MSALRGKRIVNTRAPHQQADLAALLREFGAESVAYPCIDITPPANTDALRDALRNLAAFDWLILTSSNTVRALMQLDAAPDWCAVKVAAVGQATADAYTQATGQPVQVVPDAQIAEGLAAALGTLHGQRVLLPQSAKARDTLAAALTASGAEIVTLTAYENITGSGGDDVPAMMDAGQIDALTFTSPSTITGFVQRAGDIGRDLPAACIGPRTGSAARDAGFTRVIVPPHYALRDMLTALAAYFQQAG